ncbi:carbohydrate-binding family 9-like protein [Roseivirga sp.]|uniref:carbohydrate-binding family 9-like protein n=1 Tax=Roseivirga sp. TaxID=1964215 RepID=UPI003B517FD4
MLRLYTTTLILLLSTLAYAQYPLIESRAYICKQPAETIVIDGKADESSWINAQWTSDFVDIEGDKRPAPSLQTRVKMLWDEDYFYFYAELEEPHIWARLKQRDTVIFYDNDFEIFIDPDGDTQSYYEFEVNAFNTVWDLMLTRAYRDNGQAIDNWDINGLQSAVHIEGSLNDPSDKDKYWSVEVAMPWSVLEEAAFKGKAPKARDVWRVNFSRVQWDTRIVNGQYEKVINPDRKRPVEHNWVWSPQRVINMHEPEFWGQVMFSASVVGETDQYVSDFGSEEVRQLLSHVHRSQKQYKKDKGEFNTSKDELLSSKVFNVGRPIVWELQADKYRYHAIMQHPFNAGILWHIDETGRLWKEFK